MGNRTNLLLTKPKEKTSNLVFEANNHLPIFWIFLLDKELILENKNRLITIFYNDNEIGNSCIEIPNEKIQNKQVIVNYLSNNYPDLKNLFIEFIEYLKSIAIEGVVEVELLEIANFSSPEELFNNLFDILSRIEKNEKLSELENSEHILVDFFYLVGHDDYSDLNNTFSNFSPEYNLLKTALTQAERVRKEKIIQERKEKSILKYILFEVIFMGLGGFIFFIAGIGMLIDVKIGLGFWSITTLLLGISSIIYAYIKFKDRNCR